VSAVVKVQRLPHAEGLPLPRYETTDAAGLDLLAAVPHDAPVTIEPLRRGLIPTGLILQLPSGTEAQVRPRSGLALRHGVTVLNAPGLIDAPFRGELGVILLNTDRAAEFTVRAGDRVAQLVIVELGSVTPVAAGELDVTARGSGGFGSTGVD